MFLDFISVNFISVYAGFGEMNAIGVKSMCDALFIIIIGSYTFVVLLYL